MRRSAFAVVLVCLFLCLAIAADAAKPKPKPAPKKPAAPSVQLAGNNGVFGTVYSIRKDSPLYFRLKSAEYTTEQVSIGETLYVPKADEKLLVLHFTVQNPLKTQQFVRYDSLSFTAVDSENNNHEGNNDWGDDDAKAHPRIAADMKPAQTFNVITVIVVSAKGSIPKLMVMPGDDNGPVLRYALAPDSTAPKQNKPGALTAPMADTSDPTGYTALETVPGVVGTAYPYASLDVKVEKFEYTKNAIGDNIIEEEGEQFFLVTILMKNDTPSEQFVRWDTFSPILTSTDGEELSYIDMFFASSNRPYAQDMKAGAEVRTRMLFKIPKDVTPKTLALKEDESRTYEFEVK